MRFERRKLGSTPEIAEDIQDNKETIERLIIKIRYLETGKYMPEEERRDPTLSAIRQNWVIILTLIAGLTAWNDVSNAVGDLVDDMEDVQGLLNREAFTKFAVWQTNTNRDIKDLQKGINKCELPKG